ncbi:MAG: HAMP domain-containing histidine kinase [Sedimentisphaerales bacterium]|nr:HAMP domain-containing histidine kinase [Sedimentisphaerales bacterium]
MKATGKITAGQNQLRWVVLLLAIAVILPTVCLLWFMSHAVRNERLAVKQKLTDVYQQRLDSLSQRLDKLWSDRINAVGSKAAGHGDAEIFGLFAGRDIGENGLKLCDAAIVYDSNDKLIYPVTAGYEDASQLPDEFNKAWRAEFIEEDFVRATGLYEQIADTSAEDYVRNSALMGKVRCLRKSGDIEKAVSQCGDLAYRQSQEGVSSSSVSLIARARVLLVDMKAQTEDGLGRSDVQKLIDSAVNYTPGGGSDFLPMPSETRIFLLRKALEVVENGQWAEEFGPEVLKAKELLSTEELAAAFLNKYNSALVAESWSEDNALRLISSLRVLLKTIEGVEWSYSDFAEQLRRQISIVLDSYQTKQAAALAAASKQSALAELLESWPEDSFRRLDMPQEVFGVHRTIGDRTYILLRAAEALRSDFDLCSDGLEELGVSCRIMDGSGKCVSGLEAPEEAAFLHAPLGKFFPGWRAEVHFSDVDIFEKTANRQKAIYIWAGLLAIAVMVAAGLLTAQAIGKQIKINKLKNDFIATVSHELKTPLASMRVLVDTLLEGSYRDQQQVTEYLELVSKENERLTGLIDNFLTFSRMERNKQAFAMTRTSPAAIARDAAEAVKTKFSKGQCSFKVNIPDDLPYVTADRDAMVTVLVNLLDNAYKYSYDDKRIELSVSSEDGLVCFSVSDNGAGISRRSVKKIFNRFYQVDRSLARRAEGCGLGLSIAKFIVDAHKGTISVDSKPGEGSAFTVRLPTGN